MTDEAATRANDLTAAFLLRKFREDTRESLSHAYTARTIGEGERHLVDCPSVKVAEQEGANGTYGCDTGCEYARLTAVIRCGHGLSFEFGYGDFGDLADLIEEIIDEERHHTA